MINPFRFRRKPKKVQVKIGQTHVDLKPLELEQAISLALLMAPHLAVIEMRLPEIRRSLANAEGRRPQLLRSIFIEMRDELAEMPGDVFEAFALLLHKDRTWLAEQGVSAADLIEALPSLDQINDFSSLWTVLHEFGLSVQYSPEGVQEEGIRQ